METWDDHHLADAEDFLRISTQELHSGMVAAAAGSVSLFELRFYSTNEDRGRTCTKIEGIRGLPFSLNTESTKVFL